MEVIFVDGFHSVRLRRCILHVVTNMMTKSSEEVNKRAEHKAGWVECLEAECL